MEKEKLDIQELLVRYWGGSADTSEKVYLWNWIRSSEENRRQFIEFRNLWLSTAIDTDYDLKTEIALTRFKERVLLSEQKKQTFRKRLFYISQIAALFIVAFGLGLLTFRMAGTRMDNQIINQILMPEGHKGKVVLSDGSLVWLNSGSKLIYPETFSKKKREVSLEGEGYFEITPDKDKPFFVKADEVMVKVLGTKFDVMNYPSKKNIEVNLIEGSIRVTIEGMNEKEFILQPNEKLSLRREDKQTWINQTNAAISAIWINERMAFDNKSLSYIIPFLEGWYGKEIVCDKNIAENTNLTFTVRQDSLEDVMKSITLISSLRYEIKDDIVYIF